MPKIFSEGGYSNISETTGNRQMELGYDIFRVGCGEHSPIFIFFYPTRKVSNPRLHLTVSCRFQNSFGIEFSFLPCSNSRTPLAWVHETPVGEDILFCGRNTYVQTQPYVGIGSRELRLHVLGWHEQGDGPLWHGPWACMRPRKFGGAEWNCSVEVSMCSTYVYDMLCLISPTPSAHKNEEIIDDIKM